MVPDDMRAGDSDRQVAADRLRGALDEGRLDLHEYDQRLQRAYAARTYGELNAVLADLPSTVPTQWARVVPAAAAHAPAAGTQPAHPDATRRWLVDTWDSYGLVVGITVAIWLTTAIAGGGLHNFWPIWVAGPWGAILLWQTFTGLSRGEPQRWAEKQERKRARQDLDRGRAARRDAGPSADDGPAAD